MASEPGTEPRPKQPPQNSFVLMVTGQIEKAEFISVTNAYCKYCFVYGPDWKQVGGLDQGLSPSGNSQQQRGSNTSIALNTPIEATFRTTNPFKWPQIVLSFYGQDLLGNDVVRGYSVTHLPTVPGSTKRKCPIFLPQSTTTMQWLLGLFTGRRAEFADPRILAVTEGRDVIRVKTHGFVELSLNTVLRDVKKIGYEMCAQKMGKFAEFPINTTESVPIGSSVKEEREAPKKHPETEENFPEKS